MGVAADSAAGLRLQQQHLFQLPGGGRRSLLRIFQLRGHRLVCRRPSGAHAAPGGRRGRCVCGRCLPRDGTRQPGETGCPRVHHRPAEKGPAHPAPGGPGAPSRWRSIGWRRWGSRPIRCSSAAATGRICMSPRLCRGDVPAGEKRLADGGRRPRRTVLYRICRPAAALVWTKGTRMAAASA